MQAQVCAHHFDVHSLERVHDSAGPGATLLRGLQCLQDSPQLALAGLSICLDFHLNRKRAYMGSDQDESHGLMPLLQELSEAYMCRRRTR